MAMYKREGDPEPSAPEVQYQALGAAEGGLSFSIAWREMMDALLERSGVPAALFTGTQGGGDGD